MTTNALVRFIYSLACLWWIGAVAPIEAGSRARAYLLYVGTFTEQTSAGIYAYRFHPASGEVEFLGLAAATSNPTFLAVHPNQKILYAVNESADQRAADKNSVTAFRIEQGSGKLTMLDQASSAGIGPCHLAVSRDGRVLLVANCGSGSLAAIPIREDGSLGQATAVSQHQGSGANPQRQKGPHAHGVVILRNHKVALAADLGLDTVFLYRLNSRKGSLAAADPAAVRVHSGAGVRHLAFDPGERFLYAIGELDSTLTVFRYLHGALTEIQAVSALGEGARLQGGGSEVEVDRKGRFLYASVRGTANTLEVFALDPLKGTLKHVQQVSSEGKTPRHFLIDPTGSFLFAADQNSHLIAMFPINAETGRLGPIQKALGEIDSPASLAFVENRP